MKGYSRKDDPNPISVKPIPLVSNSAIPLVSAGDRTDAPNVAIVLVDSASDDTERTVEKGLELQADGINVFVVAVGDNVNRTELELIATDQNVMYVNDFTDLTSVTDAVLADACFLSGKRI